MKKFIFMTLGLFLIHSIHATDHDISSARLLKDMQRKPIERTSRAYEQSIKRENNLFPVFIDQKEANEILMQRKAKEIDRIKAHIEDIFEEYWNTPDGIALLELAESNKKTREQNHRLIVSTLFFVGSVITHTLIQKN